MEYQRLWKFAPDSEAAFLLFAQAYLKHKQAGQHAWGAYGIYYPEQRVLYRWLLRLAHCYGHFQSLSDTEFAYQVDTPPAYARPYSGYYRHRWGVGWYKWHGVEHREGMAFRQHGCEKKAKYSQREEHRCNKGKYRDHGKRRSCRYKTYAKREFNSKYRAQNKNLLRQGRWEEMHDTIRKPYYD